jgi:TolB protein
MKTKLPAFIACVSLLAAGILLRAQRPQEDIGGKIVSTGKPAIAIPDFRGAGTAQPLMNGFNATLWDELQNSGRLKMVAKTVYPLDVPQQPADFKPPTTAPPLKRGEPQRIIRNGPWLTDWAGPPVNTTYLAFGYTAVQDGRLILAAWLYNVTGDINSAQVIGKRYFGSLDAEGAKKVAREFAADILQQFGGISLSGTKIYFVSDRTGSKEIWSMDYDGSNQKPFTNYRSPVSTSMPAISADGKLLAFSSYLKRPGENLALPQVVIHSTETGKRLQFYNPVAPTNTTPEFAPDGKHVLFASSIGEIPMQIFMADLNGGNLQRISHVRSIELSPKVNPKNGSEIVFISDASGTEQLWRMNLNGVDRERLTTGEGYVANPSWSPDGTKVAFCWTKGYDPGNYNIFIMDVATKVPNQLTHGAGRNENPTWAPDGIHLVFCSRRSGTDQIYTMLVDGSNVQRLTTQGINTQPVWAKAIN